MDSNVYIFDLGGVISVPTDIHKIYYDLNAKIDFESFQKIWYDDKDVIAAHMGLMDDKIVFERILEKIKSKLNFEQLEQILYAKEQYYQDTLDFIYELKKKNKKIYLLSNLRAIDFKHFSETFDVSIFNSLFLSYKMKMLKPNKEIYEKVIEQCQCNPKDIYFFDDNIKNVNAAIQCGINAYQVTGDNIKKFVNSELII